MTSTMDPPPPGDAPPPPPPGDPTPPPVAHASRKLRRSCDDRMIAGVAGGIAETYGIDATLIRIILAVAAVFTAGAVLVAYGIAWLVIPETDGRVVARDLLHGTGTARWTAGLWFGIVLCVAGVFALIVAWHVWPVQVLGPLTLIGLGAAVLLLRDHQRPANDTASAGPAARAATATATSAATAARATTAAANAAPARTEGSESTDRAATTAAPTQSAYETQTWPTAPTPPAGPVPPRPRKPRRPRSRLGPLTWSALLVLAGGAWLLGLTGAVDVDPAAVLAIALGIVGLALIVGAWFGRSRGLIALGVVLTAVCAVTASLTVPLRGGIGEKVYRPATVAELQPTYRLGVGRLELDLSQLPADRGPVAVQLRTGIGHIDVIVPRDADVVMRARAGVGALGLFGDPHDGGWRQETTVRRSGTGPTITIDAHVGIGSVMIRDTNVSQEVTP